MKKISSILLVSISLIGVFLLFARTDIFPKNDTLAGLPALPANLNNKISPQKISLNTPVPILMYHHVQDISNGNYDALTVSQKNFEMQMQWLADHNFQTVNLDYFIKPDPNIKKPIILTFDDGFYDAFSNVFPVLKKYNFQATFYVSAYAIGTPGSLTKDEILQMQRAGMHFGSHTLTHQDLTTNSNERAEQEIYFSKQIIQQTINQTVADFSYPSGKLNQNIENIAANSGYQTAVTTENKINFGNIDPFRLSRLDIQNDTEFEKILKN